MNTKTTTIIRRTFICSSVAATMVPRLIAGAGRPFHQATGVRVGDVTDTTAIVWTRLTQNATRNNDGIVFPSRTKGDKQLTQELPVPPVHEIEGACQGDRTISHEPTST